jgi:hypothetical protein
MEESEEYKARAMGVESTQTDPVPKAERKSSRVVLVTP